MIALKSLKFSKNQINQAIVIDEAEDSLLEYSQIKQFINEDIRQSKKSIKLLQTNSQKFTLRKSIQKNEFSPSQLSLVPFDKSPNLSQSRKNFSRTNINDSQRSQTSLSYRTNQVQRPATFGAWSNKSTKFISRKIQIQDLIANKKEWSAKMLRKTFSSSFNLPLNSQLKSTKTTFKGSTSDLLKLKLLEDVSSSTWRKLNPQNMKSSLLIISKNQKQQRKQIFCQRQKDIARINATRMINKVIPMKQFALKLKNTQFSTFKTINLRQNCFIKHKTAKQRQMLKNKRQVKGLINPLRKQTKYSTIDNVYAQYL